MTRRKVQNRPEEDLHKAVIALFEYAMPSDAIWHHSPSEGNRHVSFKKKLKEMGFRPGWPDIEIIWRNKFIFIELKAPGKYATKTQKEVHRRLVLGGAIVNVCRSVEDVSIFLAMTMGTDWRASIGVQEAAE